LGGIKIGVASCSLLTMYNTSIKRDNVALKNHSLLLYSLHVAQAVRDGQNKNAI